MKSASRNRQSIWSLSSVVLLSALLLSPVTAATLLQVVLSQQLSQNALAVNGNHGTPVRGETSPASNVAVPRRVGDEEELLRRAAILAGHSLSDRQDLDPDPIFHESQEPHIASQYYRSLAHVLLVALLAPVQSDAPSLPATTVGSSPLAASADDVLPALLTLRAAAPPRAPPAV